MIQQPEGFTTRAERLGRYRIECAIYPSMILETQNPGSCPGTSFTALMVECMDREPIFPYRK